MISDDTIIREIWLVISLGSYRVLIRRLGRDKRRLEAMKDEMVLSMIQLLITNLA